MGAFQPFYPETMPESEINIDFMGRMTSILKPVADRYNKLNPDERYQFRRLCRNMIKWYGYVSQVVRMFDKDLHKEYIFLSYLIKLIPPDKMQLIDLEGKLQPEYYKLQKTFEGVKTGLTHTPKLKKPEDEKYKGKFTEADKVLLTTLKAKLMNNTKLQTMAKTSEPQIFAESHFPKSFDDTAQNSCLESQEAFAGLF